jgi:hypothetical protein
MANDLDETIDHMLDVLHDREYVQRQTAPEVRNPPQPREFELFCGKCDTRLGSEHKPECSIGFIEYELEHWEKHRAASMTNSMYLGYAYEEEPDDNDTG